MNEHPIKQTIHSITIVDYEDSEEWYRVGANNVTRIEPCEKSGMHANLPYFRVFKKENDEDEFCHSEFCQHNIIGVYFEK